MSIIGSVTLYAPSVEGVMLSSAAYSGNVTMPSLALSGALEGPLSVMGLTLSATAVTGSVGTGNVTLDAPDIDGYMLVGGGAVGDISIPNFVVDGSTGVRANAILPALTVAASGVSGSTARGELTLPSISGSGVIMANGEGAGSSTLRAFTLAGVAETSGVGVGSISLPSLTLSASGGSGNTATASLTIPIFTLSAGVAQDAIGTANIILPAFVMGADADSGFMPGGVMVQLDDPVFSGVVMNTRSGAVTEYSGVGANSLCSFGGLLLAATSDGIVAFAGDTDLGEQIEAFVTSGVSDFGTQQFKRVLSGYVGYRTDGDLEMTLITDDHHEYSYNLIPRNMDHQHASRVKFGRGVTGRYWQWKLANKDGSDFHLDSLSFETSVDSRGV